MKAQLRRTKDMLDAPSAEPALVWLWTDADPAVPQPGGWYLELENSVLAIRVLISPRPLAAEAGAPASQA